MDFLSVLETFGVPITMCIAFGFFIWKQNNYIQKDLTKDISDLGYELGAKNLNYDLYEKRAPLGSKIKGLWEVYQQMNTSQYKRAVTMYKRNK